MSLYRYLTNPLNFDHDPVYLSTFVRINYPDLLQLYLAWIKTGSLTTILNFKDRIQFNKIHLVAAAQSGHVELYQYFSRLIALSNDRDLIEAAVQSNSLAMVQIVITSTLRSYYHSPDLIEIAAKNGSLEIVKFLVGDRPGDYHQALMLAIRGGYFEIIEYLYQYKRYSQNNKMALEAIKYGQEEILVWLVDRGILKGDIGLTNQAAEFGYLDILKYLRSIGVNWDSELYLQAVNGGFLKIIKYAYKNGLALPRHLDLITPAAQGGWSDIIKWLVLKDVPIPENIIDRTVNSYRPVNLAVLDWIHQLGFEFSSKSVELSLKVYQPEITKYLIDNSAFYDLTDRYFLNRNLTTAVKLNDLPNYQFYSNLDSTKRYIRDSAAISEAILNHSIDIVRYSFDQSPQHYLNSSLYSTMILANQVDFFFELYNKSNGKVNIFTSDNVATAAKIGNLTLLKWLIKNGAPFGTETLDNSIKSQNIAVFRYLILQGVDIHPRYHTDRLYQAALFSGNFEVLRWLVENEFKWERAINIESAIISGYYDMIIYLIEQKVIERSQIKAKDQHKFKKRFGLVI